MKAEQTSEQVREGWDKVAAGFDALVTPHALPLSEGVIAASPLRPGMTFLDVGAGSGALSIAAARRGARVLATDLSPAMIERLKARARAQGIAGIEGQVMDGQALEIKDNTFDMAGSQNGVSLFPDAAKGLSELTRVTKPGGHVLVVSFGPLEKAEFIAPFFTALRAAAPELEGPPMDGRGTPFQMASREAMASQMSQAGLKEVGVAPAAWRFSVKDGDELWRMLLSSNPLAGQTLARLAPAQQAKALDSVRDLVAQRASGQGSATLGAEMNVGIGRV